MIQFQEIFAKDVGSQEYLSPIDQFLIELNMRWLFFLFLVSGCGAVDTTLCKQFYKPYPDYVGQRQRTRQNAQLIDAMTLYNQGDLSGASVELRKVIDKEPQNYAARMYLVSALLGSGEPYKAEMHLDFLERQGGAGFMDQVDWYNAVCWLCSGQYERAMHQAMKIDQARAHTYKAEAHELYVLLNDH